jgi:hypothetical protein
MDMGSDPCRLSFVDKGFDIGILAVSHNTYEYTCFYDLRRITYPIDLDLFARFAGYVHGSTTFLLILLDVITKLRIHKRLLIVQATIFHVFGHKSFLLTPFLSSSLQT